MAASEIDRDEAEAEGHELNDRPEADHRRTNPHASEAFFRDRRVDHALGTKAVEHPLGDLVGSVVLGNLLTHDEDAVIALHLLAHRLVQSFAIGKNGHDYS